MAPFQRHMPAGRPREYTRPPPPVERRLDVIDGPISLPRRETGRPREIVAGPRRDDGWCDA